MATISSNVYIRPYNKEIDREAVAHVCRYTASHTIQNMLSPEPTKGGEVEPEPLVPHMWAYPYLDLYPEYCFVVAQCSAKEEQAVGYIVCAPDTLQYVRKLDEDYIPDQLKERPWLHRDWRPEEKENESEEEKKARKLITMLHYPIDAIVAHRYPSLVKEFPAHLHINVLDSHQSGGWGTKLIEHLFHKLRKDGILGIHLGCNEENYRAIKFYERMGFEPWEGCKADGRKGLLKDKISHGTIDVTGMCMVKKL